MFMWLSEKFVICQYIVANQREQFGPLQTLYRDLLLSCGFLQPSKSEEQPKERVFKRPRTRAASNNEGIQESESVSECTFLKMSKFSLIYLQGLWALKLKLSLVTCLVFEKTRLTYLSLILLERSYMAQEPVESNPDEPAKEYLPEWKPVEGNLDEPESHCTAPDVFCLSLRPQP